MIGFVDDSGLPYRPEFISIQGVCDYVVGDKNTAWQYYASANGGAFLHHRDLVLKGKGEKT